MKSEYENDSLCEIKLDWPPKCGINPALTYFGNILQKKQYHNSLRTI